MGAILPPSPAAGVEAGTHGNPELSGEGGPPAQSQHPPPALEASILGCCLKWFASLSLVPWLSVECHLPSGPRSLNLPLCFSPKPHPVSRTDRTERRGRSPTPDLPPAPLPCPVSLRVAGSHSRGRCAGLGLSPRGFQRMQHLAVPQTPRHGLQSVPCPFPSSTHACPAAGRASDGHLCPSGRVGRLPSLLSVLVSFPPSCPCPRVSRAVSSPPPLSPCPLLSSFHCRWGQGSEARDSGSASCGSA